MTRSSIVALIREGRIERVPQDTAAGRAKIDEARRHVVSASAIARTDAEGAYALLYDAARKAIDAHMLACGYRVRKGRLGAHEATVLYAVAALASRTEHVLQFDRTRRNRNRSEYGAWAIGAATVKRDLEHATGIVDAVESDM